MNWVLQIFQKNNLLGSGNKSNFVAKSPRGTNTNTERTLKSNHSSINLTVDMPNPSNVIEKMNNHAGTQFLPTMNYFMDFFEDRDIRQEGIFIKTDVSLCKDIILELEKGQLPKLSDLDENYVAAILKYFSKFLLELLTNITGNSIESISAQVKDLSTLPTLKNLFGLFRKISISHESRVNSELLANSLKPMTGLSLEVLKLMIDHSKEIFGSEELNQSSDNIIYISDGHDSNSNSSYPENSRTSQDSAV